MDFKKAAQLLLANEFRFAKTMPQNPHWYTLRKTWANDKEFAEVVAFIRANSYTEYFFKKPFQMFLLNGFKYWTMGAPIDITILINKAVQHNHVPYDEIADQYVKLFHDEESIAEDKELFKMLDIRGKILDIGCGSGLFLDYFQPEDYTGIDPSGNMLSFLKEKHPDYQDKVIQCRFEDFYGDGYDTIVALYGSASYISPEVIDRIKDCLAPGGNAYLMFYKDGYDPVTYQKTGHEIGHYLHPEISGQSFHNYKIVTVAN